MTLLCKVSRKELLKTLRNSASPKTAHLPILGYVGLRTINTKLQIISTNLEQGLTQDIPAKIENIVEIFCFP